MAGGESNHRPDSATSSKPGSSSQSSNGRRRGGSNNRGRDGNKHRGGNRGAGRGGKAKDAGDQEISHGKKDKRGRNDDRQDLKRRKLEEVGPDGEREPNYMSIQFPDAEIAAEERRPKRKVAVMIGYSGTGYHGMQINHKDKTIEGDLFAAFVAAGAIAKANADDPRKSSLVRCARTDKGVHAAGNVISLKLIIEEEDVIEKINANLPPQIRVWGIQRTNNAFSAYQSCDSRWYEYLMPSYCLLPPHPESFIGKKIHEFAKDMGLVDEYVGRWSDVKDFWEEMEKNDVQPILDGLDSNTREEVLRLMKAGVGSNEELTDKPVVTQDVAKPEVESEVAVADKNNAETTQKPPGVPQPKEFTPAEIAHRKIKAAYVAAKRRYRVTPERLSQLQKALDKYVGTKNFHNYTVKLQPTDPSAKRHIKSFVANPEPIQINDTQWLSLKVHGQSFMMHQIRKMVAMAVLIVRCATPFERLDESYGAERISIPKAPGLGLLLERPVFDFYNKRATDSFDKPAIDFGNYEKEIQAFKDTHIYKNIFELEEMENSFHAFFHQIDNYKSDHFLWVTAGGMEAAHKRSGGIDDVPEGMQDELGDEEDPEGGGG